MGCVGKVASVCKCRREFAHSLPDAIAAKGSADRLTENMLKTRNRKFSQFSSLFDGGKLVWCSFDGP